MENWQGLAPELRAQYAVIHVLKRTEEKEIVLLKHTETGHRVLLRNYPGEILTVYQLLSGKHLNHVPRILAVKQHEHGYYVLEEFLEGKSLTPGSICTHDAFNILHQLCDALSELHSLGIVHRDVKPDNLLMSNNGKLYLVDLDAARLYKNYVERDTCTLGTAGFAAPEQFGISQTDHRADIFALGITLNVLLTGAHPSEVLCKGHFRRIVLKCTKIDPKTRYQNAHDVWLAASYLGFFAFLGKHKKVLFSALALIILILPLTMVSQQGHNAEAIENTVISTTTTASHTPATDIPSESGTDIETTPDTMFPTLMPLDSTIVQPTESPYTKPSISPETKPKPTKPAVPSETRPTPTKPTIPPDTKPKPTKPTVPSETRPTPTKPTVPSETRPKPTKPTTPSETRPTPTEPTAPPEVMPNPTTDPNDITQKEGYAEVIAAHEAYYRAGAKELNAIDSYERWLKEPPKKKMDELDAVTSSLKDIENDCKLQTAIKREALEDLQAAVPPDESAIALAQREYDSARAQEETATKNRIAASDEAYKYGMSSEYLIWQKEEERRYKAWKDASADSGKALVYLNNIEKKYGIHIFIPNDACDPYR